MERLRSALGATKIAGIACNRDLLLRIVGHPDFSKGAQDTGFIPRHRVELLSPAEAPLEALIAASLAVLLAPSTRRSASDAASPWQHRDFWRLLGDAGHRFRFRDGDRERELTLHFAGERYRCDIEGREVAVQARQNANGDLEIELEGRRFAASILRTGSELWVALPEKIWRLIYLDPVAPAHRAEGTAGKIVAPMPGKVSAILVAPETPVKRGQVLMQIEAMKMELAITAPEDGVVAAINFVVGALVEEGAELAVLRVADDGGTVGA